MKGLYEELNAQNKLLFFNIAQHMTPLNIGLIILYIDQFQFLPSNFQGIDFKELVKYVHYLYVASFHFQGPWDATVNFGTTKNNIVRLFILRINNK